MDAFQRYFKNNLEMDIYNGFIDSNNGRATAILGRKCIKVFFQTGKKEFIKILKDPKMNLSENNVYFGFSSRDLVSIRQGFEFLSNL